ncbi:MAG: CAP domain-containing protein [Gammaproteobacteria bacterium]|nr:CAP domain-containing protein [Gammaproteobacteria bacterium]
MNNLRFNKVFLSSCLVALLVNGCGGNVAPPPPVITPAADTQLNCDTYVTGTTAKDDFLCAHNAVRATANPVPSPELPALSWNDNLATVAQAWADQCNWSHNPDRAAEYNSLSGEATSVGENLYLTTFSNPAPDAAVTAWAAEASSYDYATNSCATGEVCGHYTQLVWRDTLNVGCGMKLCSTVAGTTMTNATIMVCNYEMAGNWIGVAPY